MKINLKKLTKLQEEFKEGNLLQNITAWDILDFTSREGGTISLHSLIKAMEEGDICNCEEVDKALKRDKTLDFLLEERKWWEFWKAK